LVALGLSPAAFAQAAEPSYTLSGNVGVVSDYRFRGIAQTSYDPALQAGVDFAHKSGLYVGAFVSSVKWIKEYVGASTGDTEIDLYGGYKGSITKDLSYDVGAIGYMYPGNNASSVAGYVNADTFEVYGALTYGIVTAKYSRSTSNFVANANSSGSAYFELAATFDLGNGYTLTPRIGRQTVPNQNNVAGTKTGNAADYTDYALTLGKDFGNGLAVSLAAVGTSGADSGVGGFYTDTKNKFLGQNTAVLGLKYTF
jgi:uncharacterized protein (TIGR02001 family)